MVVNIIVGGVLIGRDELDIMSRIIVIVFEILERSWVFFDCSFIDMKIEFGVKFSIGCNSVLLIFVFLFKFILR